MTEEELIGQLSARPGVAAAHVRESSVTTTAMSHRGGQDNDDVTSPWLRAG